MEAVNCHWCHRRTRQARYAWVQVVRLWSAPRSVEVPYTYCSRRCERSHRHHR
jgi:hypothetical protein